MRKRWGDQDERRICWRGELIRDEAVRAYKQFNIDIHIQFLNHIVLSRYII